MIRALSCWARVRRAGCVSMGRIKLKWEVRLSLTGEVGLLNISNENYVMRSFAMKLEFKTL